MDTTNFQLLFQKTPRSQDLGFQFNLSSGIFQNVILQKFTDEVPKAIIRTVIIYMTQYPRRQPSLSYNDWCHSQESTLGPPKRKQEPQITPHLNAQRRKMDRSGLSLRRATLGFLRIHAVCLMQVMCKHCNTLGRDVGI